MRSSHPEALPGKAVSLQHVFQERPPVRLSVLCKSVVRALAAYLEAILHQKAVFSTTQVLSWPGGDHHLGPMPLPSCHPPPLLCSPIKTSQCRAALTPHCKPAHCVRCQSTAECWAICRTLFFRRGLLSSFQAPTHSLPCRN